MKERERKFKLIRENLPKELPEPFLIRQAYLMFDGNRHLRVRLNEYFRATLGIKDVLNSTDKNEYEFNLREESGEAFELYCRSPYKVIKERVSFNTEDLHIDIDRVVDSGREWVEIEYADEIKEIPAFCGEEVTGLKEYSNIWIAKNEPSVDSHPTVLKFLKSIENGG